jgi:hypothetical protein
VTEDVRRASIFHFPFSNSRFPDSCCLAFADERVGGRVVQRGDTNSVEQAGSVPVPVPLEGAALCTAQHCESELQCHTKSLLLHSAYLLPRSTVPASNRQLSSVVSVSDPISDPLFHNNAQGTNVPQAQLSFTCFKLERLNRNIHIIINHVRCSTGCWKVRITSSSSSPTPPPPLRHVSIRDRAKSNGGN